MKISLQQSFFHLFRIFNHWKPTKLIHALADKHSYGDVHVLFFLYSELYFRKIGMGYWPSLRSRWLDIGQVLFLHVYGPRQSRGP